MPSEDTQWKKGQSGNPKGRPKGSLSLTAILKEKLEKIPKGEKLAYKDLFIEKLLDKALVDGDFQSLKIIMNYVDGMPLQKIGGDKENPLVFMPSELMNKYGITQDAEDNSEG